MRGAPAGRYEVPGGVVFITNLEHGKTLSDREVNELLGNLGGYYGYGVPEGGWEKANINDYDFKHAKSGHVETGNIPGHGQTVIGYFEEATNSLKFFVTPDEALVAHEYGHWLYHQMYPGKCSGGTSACEDFANKIENELANPKGPIAGIFPRGPLYKQYRKHKYGF